MDAEADVVRLAFKLYAEGWGVKAIVKHLNASRLPAPRSQQGRPRGWVHTSLRAVLRRPIYSGQVVWNRTRKRNAAGLVQQHARPESDWMTTAAPHLQIVDPATWAAVQARFNSRERYRNAGRPAKSGAKYLLTGLLRCVCGSGFEANIRKTGRSGKQPVYCWAASQHRGPTVCANNRVIPMDVADAAVLDAVMRDLLNPDIFDAAIEKALVRVAPVSADADLSRIRTELATVQQQLSNLTEAITLGGNMPALVEALREREARRTALTNQLHAGEKVRPAFDHAATRRAMRSAISDWQKLLQENPTSGQRALRALIIGKLNFTPTDGGYAFTGQGAAAPIYGVSFLRLR